MDSAAACSTTVSVVDSLFIAATMFLWDFFVFGPSFIVQYFVSFKVLQSSG